VSSHAGNSHLTKVGSPEEVGGHRDYVRNQRLQEWVAGSRREHTLMDRTFQTQRVEWVGFGASMRPSRPEYVCEDGCMVAVGYRRASWRLDGDWMEIGWRLDGDWMEIGWRLVGDRLETGSPR
jgi:hypothetical protein